MGDMVFCSFVPFIILMECFPVLGYQGQNTFGCAHPSWHDVESDCFKYFSHPKHWLAAHSDCVSKGGTLAIFDEPSQFGYFTNKLAPAWIGVSKNTDGYWRWLTDNSVEEPIPWAPGQPDDDPDKLCVQEDNNGEWFNVDCGGVTGYICREGFAQFDDDIAPQPTKWLRDGSVVCPYTGSFGLGPDDPVYKPFTGFCYAYLMMTDKWPSLGSECAESALGLGRALDILDEEEDFVFFAEIVTKLGSSGFEPWIGINDRDDAGLFELYDRATATSYTNINPRYTNSGNCYLMTIEDGGTWRPDHCSVQYDVWCKFIPATPVCATNVDCSRGRCRMEGVCKCERYWTVDDNAICNVCYNDKACGNGKCVNGTCVCDSGAPYNPNTLDCTDLTITTTETSTTQELPTSVSTTQGPTVTIPTLLVPTAAMQTTQSPNIALSTTYISSTTLINADNHTNTSGPSSSTVSASTVENYEETEDELLRRLPSYVFGGVLISLVTVVIIIDFTCLIKSSCFQK